MKKLTTLAISAAALTGIAVADADVSFSTGVHSDYIYRGVDLGDDQEFADFGLDVAGSCDCGVDWYAGIWYASTTGTAVDELDIFAGISKDLGFGSVDFGYITYTYSEGTQNDAELYLGFSTTLAGVDLGANWSVGTDGGWESGSWVDLSAGYGYEGLNLELGLGFAFGSANYAPDVDGLATYSATLSYEYAISDDITISPYVSYVINTDDYEGAAGDDEHFYGGASLSYAF